MMKNIVVQPLGGLCNRMRVIVGAMTLAKILDRSLSIIWTRDKTLNSRFDELFEPLICPVKETELTSIPQRIRWNLYMKVLGYMLIDDVWMDTYSRDKSIKEWIDKIQDKNLMINANLDIISGGDYSIFKAKKSVVETVNNVKCDENTIGLHIRRTDNVKAIKYSPTSLFFEKVREELNVNPQTKFYLATDDPKEEDAFIAEFGDSIITYRKHSLDRNNPVAIKDALIDLYNLSQCRKIYGSYWSSFSDTAALWSGIEKVELKK